MRRAESASKFVDAGVRGDLRATAGDVADAVRPAAAVLAIASLPCAGGGWRMPHDAGAAARAPFPARAATAVAACRRRAVAGVVASLREAGARASAAGV